VSKLLRELYTTQNEVDSLVCEVEARLRNPNGCLDFIHNLENQLKEVQQEIDNMKSELTK
jgi:hypothetical protein